MADDPDDTKVLIGFEQIWGITDWRMEREPIATRGRPLWGDRGALDLDEEIGDARTMEKKIDWCGKCRTQMEHEVLRGESGASVLSCLGCRQREATKQDLMAATAARNAAKPKWVWPAVIGGAIAVMVVAGLIKKSQQTEDPYTSSGGYRGSGRVEPPRSDCTRAIANQVAGLKDAADRACKCSSLRCATDEQKDAGERGLLVDACAGATEGDRHDLTRAFQALAVCVEVHR